MWKETRKDTDNCTPMKVNPLGWSLKVDGEYQPSFDKELLYDVSFGKKFSIPYENKRVPLEYGHSDDINREAIGRAVATFPAGNRRWFTKQVSGTCATAKVMRRRGDWITDRCPQCFTALEDNDHILNCPSSNARKTWKLAVKELIEKLEEINTESYICEVIEQRLLTWPKPPRELFTYDPLPKETRIAMISQDNLGWRAFIFGRTATTWEDAQEKWIIRTATRFKRSSHKWAATLVEQIFRIQWKMWESRNTVLHDPEHLWKKREREKWNAEINVAFTSFNAGNFLPSANIYFTNNQKTVLQYPDELKVQWLASIKNEIRRKRRRDENNRRLGENLRQWLR